MQLIPNRLHFSSLPKFKYSSFYDDIFFEDHIIFYDYKGFSAAGLAQLYDFID
jgi:hypothetical protein